MLKITKLLQGRGKNLGERGNSRRRKWFFNWKKRMMLTAIAFVFMASILPVIPVNTKASIPLFYEKEPNVMGYQEIYDLDRTLELEVKNYIKENSFGSRMNAKKFIRECYKENFDIILALSQAQVESHFGTRGVASRTNSVFNVGTFDNGIILYRYTDPNKSIYPYISLMKRSYLVNEKTSKDLLKPRAFVNYKGNRYASFKYYEHRVKKVYDHIHENTSIKQLWYSYRQRDAIYSRQYWKSADLLYSLIK